MSMKVTLDREQYIVWIEDVSAKWACWVGYYFVHNHPGLTYWRLKAESPPKSSKRMECHKIDELETSAGAIAGFINNPPKTPDHCKTCTCLPECCK